MNDEVAGPIESSLRRGSNKVVEGNISNLLGQLDALNDTLYSAISKLADTIQPILRSTDTETQDTMAKSPSNSDTSGMADWLNRIRYTMDNHIEYLNSVTRRVDL